MKKAGLILTFTLLVQFSIIPKYHPGLKWREIKQDNFIVIFPKGYESEAVFTMEEAIKIYRELLEFWKSPVVDPIRIVLADVSDVSNGSASHFPFNLITIQLFDPPPDSVLGNCREWIRLVLSHEMTHIINFNAGSKTIRSLRSILGHHPLLYPIALSPLWMIEGMAIYGESKITENGRLNTPDYSIILEKTVQEDTLPTRREIFGEPTFWPGPESKYLFGSKFIQYLVEKYGENKIQLLPIFYSKYLVTLSSSHRFKQFFQQDLSALWNEFEEHVRLKKEWPQENITRITDNGMSKQFPIFIGGDRAIYVFRDYKKYPGIWEINLKTYEQKQLLERANITGITYSAENQTLYFSALDYYKSYFKYSDIFAFNLGSNKVKRLSTGDRLSYPVKIPGDEKIICVKRKKDKSFLCLYDLKSNQFQIISRAFEGIAFPVISPDKRYIAVSLKRKNRKWGIALFDLKGNLHEILIENDKKNYYPQWKNNYQIYFITEYQGKYCLGKTDLNTNQPMVFDDRRMPPLRYFSLLPDPDQILFIFYDTSGYNMGLSAVDDLIEKPLSLSDEKKPACSDIHQTSSQIPDHRYNAWRDLLPKYLSFSFRYAGNEIQPGLVFFGNDAVNQHLFSIQGFYGGVSRTSNFKLNYTYDGFYPTLMLNINNLTDLNQNENRERYLYTSKLFEFIGLTPIFYSETSQSYVYADIHFENIIETYDLADAQYHLKLNGFKVGFLHNSAKRYYDSFSQADGISFSLSYSRELKLLGSDFDLNTLAFEYKHYLTLFRPNALAIRLGISGSWGNGEKILYMGGALSKNEFHIAGRNLFNMMRGYPSGYFPGTGGVIINLEYRFSLAKMERTVFISQRVERLFLSLFMDIGNMWQEEIKIDPAYSIGTELSVILYFGKKVTVSGGIAIGRHPYSEPVFYLRIGESF